MIKWIKKKLGILALERQVEITHRAVNRIEKKIRIGKKPMRYDEIERARKHRKKSRAA